jgi:hypothetical protein
MALIWLILAFGAFMLVIASVHLINAYAASRWGYEPFSAPNTALMLIPSGVLLSLLRSGVEPGAAAAGPGPAALVGGGLWVVFLLGMLVLLARRTNLWIALYAAPLLALAAPVIFFALLYRWLVTPTGAAD